MKKSPFQFTEPKLIKLDFSLNEDFDIKDVKRIVVNVVPQVEVVKQSDNEYYVSLLVTLGTQDASSPFFVQAQEGARFRLDSGVSMDVEQLLHFNAPALLLSYLRPTIAMVTAASPYSAYNIPFMNFTDSEGE